MKWSKSIILLFLGLLIKVSVAENSTQAFLFELESDLLIYESITNHLEGFIYKDGDTTVSDVTFTTNCTESSDGMKMDCTCEAGYTWTSDICEKYSCCNTNNCILNYVDAAVCLSDKRVSINGSTIMTKIFYQDFFDINNQKTAEYQNNINNITDQLISSYSTLPWFYSLVITNIRKGSVIVDYVVQLLGPLVNINQLQIIANKLNGSTIVTQGVVTIHVNQRQPVLFNSVATIKCETQQNLGSVKWFLKDVKNKTKEITYGTEATLTKANLSDTLNLKNISEIWKGTFTCQYTTNSILHKAIGQLDVALLPEIRGISDPQFPDCRGPNQKIMVTIECAIPYSTEEYTVTWDSREFRDSTKQPAEYKSSFISHKLEATLDCSNTLKETVTPKCIFTNKRVQDKLFREKTVEIFIITKNSKACEADNDWPVTKDSYTAIKYCDGFNVGQKQRTCNGKWQPEISKCVNEELHSIQNNAKDLEKGIGLIKDDALNIFNNLQKTTTTNNFITFANINTSVHIFDVMNSVSKLHQHQWNDSVMPDIVKSASNLLNETEPWLDPRYDTNLSIKYLLSFENTMSNSNLSESFSAQNIKIMYCNTSNIDCKISNANVTSNNIVIAAEFSNLAQILPKPFKDKSNQSDAPILSITSVNNSSETGAFKLNLMFSYADQRLPNHEMFCVFWNETLKNWSDVGCKWGGVSKPNLCICDHNTSFTMLMSKSPEFLPYMDVLTYAGLGISIVSLVLCLLIEVLVWNMVVKSNISSFRHIALVNISTCLLIAYIGLLASANPERINSNWCVSLTFVKHFCFLSVFFWMLCLSFVLLHQIIFVFEQLRKKVYLVLSITLGYVCPFLCAAATFISFGNGKADEYYSNETCWLVYKSMFKGSMFAFVIPVGTIVFINMFTLFVVITKLITPNVSDAKALDEKDVARSIIKTIVFLCPVLGITWIFGLFVLMVDLTDKPSSYIVNYTFTVLNSLQGFFILLTNCIGEKKIRDALLKRFKGQKSVHSKSESSTKAGSSVMK